MDSASVKQWMTVTGGVCQEELQGACNANISYCGIFSAFQILTLLTFTYSTSIRTFSEWEWTAGEVSRLSGCQVGISGTSLGMVVHRCAVYVG